MADERFYFWRGYYDSMRMLDFERRGKLVTAMCEWAFEGREPDFSDDSTLAVIWPILRGQIEGSVEIGRKRSNAGKKSGASRRKKSANTVPNTVPNNESNDMNMYMNGMGHEMTQSLSGTAADSGVPSGTLPLDYELPPLTYE